MRLACFAKVFGDVAVAPPALDREATVPRGPDQQSTGLETYCGPQQTEEHLGLHRLGRARQALVHLLRRLKHSELRPEI